MIKLLKKKKLKLIPIIIKLVFLLFGFYLVCTLISQQKQINFRKKRLDEINNKIAIQNTKNEELKHFLNKAEEDNSEYLEHLARESLDLVKKGERVFVNISGN